MPFFKLFKSSDTTDGLAQSEREAIADLLHFCMYADNHLASAEDKVVDDAISHMGWDPAVSFETFESRSLARVRAAKENLDSRNSFYQSLQERLVSKNSRARALNLCTKLFQADGTTDKESALLIEVKRLLA
jgi:hypothetical protein